MRRRTRLRVVPLVALLAGPLAAGCARNPVTGHNELSLVSESQEIEMGKQSAAEVEQTIGFVDNAQLQSYVAGIGKRMASESERPNLPWEFHVVNDASVNAFALPGGFIYVTRGLLGAINDEAELATVVGHEIGHVTARHSVQQISKAQLAQLGLGVGSIVSPTLAQFAGIASQGLGVLFLKYGRDAENQADQLGFRYALGQKYDVREMANVFVTLERTSEAVGAGRLPEWLSTHPNPENRVEHVKAMLDTTPLPQSLVRNGDAYLQSIRGLVYGNDPRQGFFEGNVFYHPDMRFQIAFPQGWQTQNQPAAVVAVNEAQDAIVQLGLAGTGSPEEAARQFLSQQGVQPGQSSNENINGNPATTSSFRAQTEQGEVEGLVSFVAYGGKTFGIMGYTKLGGLQQYQNAFRETIGSFGPLRNQSALSVQPAKLDLVRVDRQMTLDEFNRQYPSSIPVEELAIINELEGPAAAIPAGRYVKRVVGGPAQNQASR
jgi:predicted Zn-dependent protease